MSSDGENATLGVHPWRGPKPPGTQHWWVWSHILYGLSFLMGKVRNLHVNLAYKYPMSSIKIHSLDDWSLELWEVVGGADQVEWRCVNIHQSFRKVGPLPDSCSSLCRGLCVCSRPTVHCLPSAQPIPGWQMLISDVIATFNTTLWVWDDGWSKMGRDTWRNRSRWITTCKIYYADDLNVIKYFLFPRGFVFVLQPKVWLLGRSHIFGVLSS